MKQLKILGIIDPPMIDDLGKQVEEQDIQRGDTVEVIFDSVGGAVDVAFAIAKIFEAMQNDGVNLIAVAAGKVYSSAIVPFLAIDERVALKGCSFLVHKATYDELTDIDKDELEKKLKEINEYTDMLFDFYAEHDIDPSVSKHLKEGDDLKLFDPDEIIDAGFVPEFSNKPSKIYNRYQRAVDWLFPSIPNFSYVLNSQTIKQTTNTMTDKKIKALFGEVLKESMPELAKGVARILNKVQNEEGEEEPKEPVNEVSAFPDEALMNLSGLMHTTPVTVANQEGVKYIGHFGSDVSNAGQCVALDADFKPVDLGEGEYVANVSGTDYPIVSNGPYLSMAPVTNQEEGAEEEEAPENEDDSDAAKAAKAAAEESVEAAKAAKAAFDSEEEGENPANKKAVSAAPSNKKQPKAPVTNRAADKAFFSAISMYGPGCTGK